MAQALYISALGMALVFIGLLLLWWMMSLLVRLTQAKQQQLQEEERLTTPAELPASDRDLLPKIAAAAVVTAMGMTRPSLLPTQTDSKDLLSPWQAAHRIRQITQNPVSPSRKE